MSTFTPAEAAACDRLIKMALEEDLADVGDLTCQAITPPSWHGQAVFVARAPGVLAGLEAARRVMKAVDTQVTFEALLPDGASLTKGSRIATVEGPVASILIGERTALNFLQHLSGIATLTRRFVDAVAGLSCKILDTRKTTPGWRLLEKYAVRCGGGHNHRLGLYDGILIKDNHLAAFGASGNRPAEPDIFKRAIVAARNKFGDRYPIEVEVENQAQLCAALALTPSIVLLDNMTLDELRLAVSLRNETLSEIQLEASGGVNLDTVRLIAETGVDRISVGALTHSAPALDIALDYQQ
jgi:nicotinate-nucleotide pyrophosphorylase (carboxylating)